MNKIIAKAVTQTGLAWMFGIVFCVGFLIDKVPSEAFCSVATGVVVWWFKGKIDQKGGAA